MSYTSLYNVFDDDGNVRVAPGEAIDDVEARRQGQIPAEAPALPMPAPESAAPATTQRKRSTR